MTTYNFDILISSKDIEARYPITVIGSPAGETENPSYQRLSEDKINDLLRYTEELVADLSDIYKLGEALFNFLFTPEIKTLFDQSRGRLSQGDVLRIRIRWNDLATMEDLSRLPWESMSEGTDLLFLKSNISIVRYPHAGELKQLNKPERLRILAATATPTDEPPLNLENELLKLKSTLQESEQSSRIDLRIEENVTRNQLRQAIEDYKPHILHFAGHGKRGANMGELALTSDDGCADMVSAEELLALIQGADLQLIILNACETAMAPEAKHSSGFVTQSLARFLTKAGTPAVIGMQYRIPDEIAHNFSLDFYKALGKNKPIDQALLTTRKGLYFDQEDKNFWAIPVLYLRSDDGRLFKSTLSAEIPEYRQSLHACSSALRKHPQTMYGIQKPIPRQVSQKIIAWLLSSDESNKNVSMLLDHAGMGKSTIMRHVLTQLESSDVPALAIKADLQLAHSQTVAELQQRLNLPQDLEELVSKVATETRTIILIDQIDALSLSLTDDTEAMATACDLIARLSNIDNVRILVSCRVFDRHSDPQLKNIAVAKEFRIPPLTKEEVNNTLKELGYEPKTLSNSTYELLQVPLHLNLFAQVLASPNIGNADLTNIYSLHELYVIIWEQIILQNIRHPSKSQRERAIYKIADEMQESMSVSVHKSRIYLGKDLEQLEQALDWLQSISILISNNNYWTFMHQTFLDYCYARRFVAEKSNLHEELSSSNQGIYERTKVTYVLAYLRSQEPEHYLATLRNLLFEENLRAHLIDHIWRWFGAVKKPTAEEKQLAQYIIFGRKEEKRFLIIVQNNSDWFDYLAPQIELWLKNSDDVFIDGLVLPYLRSIHTTHLDSVMNLLMPYTSINQLWSNRLYRFFLDIKALSPKTIVVFERLLPTLNPKSAQLLYLIHQFAKFDPAATCRMVKHIIRFAYQNKLEKPRSTQRLLERNQSTHWLPRIFETISEESPISFVEELLPWFLQCLPLAEDFSQGYPRYKNDIFQYSWNSAHDVETHYLEALTNALITYAKQKSIDFHEIAHELANNPHHSAQCLLASIYAALGHTYAEDGLAFLISDSRRFNLGHWGHSRYFTQQLIKNIAPQLEQSSYSILEDKILNFSPQQANGQKLSSFDLRRWGIEQFDLISIIPRELLSTKATLRLQELERKFEHRDPESINKIEFGTVKSPIASNGAQHMGTQDWIKAIQKYSKDESISVDFAKGSALELSQELESQIQEEPEKFASLLEAWPSKTNQYYIQAVLRGLSSAKTADLMLWSFIRQQENEFNSNIYQTLGNICQKKHKAPIPNDIVKLLEKRIIKPQTQAPTINISKSSSHQNPITHAFINSEKGVIFDALMAIYHFQDDDQTTSKQWELFDIALESTNPVFRLGVISQLKYMAGRYDRLQAIATFKSLINGYNEVWHDLPLISDFIYHGFRQNFVEAAPYISYLLDDESDDFKQQGAKLACLVIISPDYFESGKSKELAESIFHRALFGDTLLRESVVRVLLHNLDQDHSFRKCVDFLELLIDDENSEIRDHYNNIFLHVSDEKFYDLKPIIELMARSKYHYLHRYLADYLLKNGLTTPNWTLRVVRQIWEKEIPFLEYNGGIKVTIRLVLQIYRKFPSLQIDAMDMFDSIMEKYAQFGNEILSEFDQRLQETY